MYLGPVTIDDKHDRIIQVDNKFIQTGCFLRLHVTHIEFLFVHPFARLFVRLSSVRKGATLSYFFLSLHFTFSLALFPLSYPKPPHFLSLFSLKSTLFLSIFSLISSLSPSTCACLSANVFDGRVLYLCTRVPAFSCCEYSVGI